MRLVLTLPIVVAGMALTFAPVAGAGILPVLPEAPIAGLTNGALGGSTAATPDDSNLCDRFFMNFGGNSEAAVDDADTVQEALALELGDTQAADDSSDKSPLCSPMGLTSGAVGMGGAIVALANTGDGSSGSGSQSYDGGSYSDSDAPVPEPTSGALFALGSVIAGWSVRRRTA